LASGREGHARYVGRWLKAGCLGLLVALLFGFALQVSASVWPSEAVDMRSYVHAGESLRAGGLGLYDLQAVSEGQWPYLYPPAFASVFAGLLAFPEAIALRLWATIVAASVVASFIGLARLGRLNQVRVAILLSVLALPTVQLVLMGQVDALVVGLLAGSLLADRNDRQRIAGTLVGLAAVIKVLPALAVLPFLILRRRRAAVAALVTVAVASLVPLLWLIPQMGLAEACGRLIGMHVEFVDRVILTGLGGNLDAWMLRSTNASLPATMFRLTGHAAPGRVVMWLLIGFGLWMTAKNREAADGVSLVVSAAVLGNIVFWPHSALVFGLPLAVAFTLPLAGLMGVSYLAAGWVSPVLGSMAYLAVWILSLVTAGRRGRLAADPGPVASPGPSIRSKTTIRV